MTSLDQQLTTFSEKHSLDESAIAELLQIWNKTFIEVTLKYMKGSGQDFEKPKKSGKKITDSKRWSSKVAGEYAQQNGLTLDDFTQEKISKKDVDSLLKERNSGDSSESKEKKTKITKNGKTVKCSGLTKKGDPCSRGATHTPDGSKKAYCFRHANDWQDFEVSSDSSDEELESEPPIARKKTPSGSESVSNGEESD